MPKDSKIADALRILGELGMPRAQRNDRSALCLLALLKLTPEKPWSKAGNPLIGITPMMDFARDHYAKKYAPNTREKFRRQTMHQFMAAGIALYNPDEPGRAVNSPKQSVVQVPWPRVAKSTQGELPVQGALRVAAAPGHLLRCGVWEMSRIDCDATSRIWPGGARNSAHGTCTTDC